MTNDVGGPDHIAVSLGGKFVATGSFEGNFLWNVSTGKVHLDLRGHEHKGKRPAIVAFTPDGKQLITAYDDKAIIWDLKGMKQEQTIAFDKQSARCLACSSDYLAVGMRDLSVHLFDRGTFKKVHTIVQCDEFLGANSELRALRFAGEGSRLVVGFQQADKNRGREVLTVFDVAAKHHVVTIVDRPTKDSQWGNASIVDVAMSRDGRMVASVGCHGHVKVWSALTGNVMTELGKLPGPPSGTTPIRFLSVAFSPNDKHIIAPEMFDDTLIWNIETQRVAKKLKGVTRGFGGLVFSPDGRIAASDEDGEVVVWDLGRFN